ncbi:hypothetical protein B0A55_00124 [Friedmanniomyces simplex]|uniref:Uncharacterized protein n=1 Tax=Friedmanniomyces simplex TaxID=329884 RepID=A0A4U0Y320_9PEZI|nr:hypothetical protein B0A55_00124 [Friedmanniomyces simplex]
MVPQFVRRRYSTMFNEHPPFAYENTDDRQDPSLQSYCSRTPPPGCNYRENPFQGYTPHAIPPPAVALDHDQVVLERIMPQDVVPALYSSPRLSPRKATEPMHQQDQEAFELMEFPSLPELVDGTDCDSPTTPTIPGGDEETPTEKGIRAYNFLRCPQCDGILKWMFVKQSKEGLHQIHGCAPACACAAGSKAQHPEQEGPVQVSRGAW